MAYWWPDIGVHLIQKESECFGIWGDNRAQNSELGRVLAYNPEKQMMGLAFPGKDGGEEVILIQDPAIKTPLQAVETLERWETSFNKTPHAPTLKTGPLDTIVIPELSLTNNADFKSQLPGRMEMGNENFISIAAAKQRVRLKLDEKGAEIITKTFVIAPTFLTAGGVWDNNSGKEAKPKERFFIFNKPFVFMIRKKDAKYPFLLAQIGGPGTIPFEK